VGSSGAGTGKWHAILKISEKYEGYFGGRPVLTHSTYSTNTSAGGAQLSGIPYSLNVHAYTNLRMRGTISQTSHEPGAKMTLRMVFTEYGMAMANVQQVKVELERPDNTTSTVSLSKVETGIYELEHAANQSGVYRFRVLGNGTTLRGRAFTREQLLTGAVYKGGDNPLPGGGNIPGDGTGSSDDKICKLLACLLSDKVIHPRLEKKLLAEGIDLEGIRSCLASYCQT
jgi:hypothetical protein